MKYKLAVLTVLTVVSSLFLSSARAQGTIGFRAGLNASNVSFDRLPGKKERIGFHVGIFGNVPMVQNFISIQPELSFSIKGARFEYLNENRTLNLNYMDFMLPVAFKLGSVDIQVGPFVSFLTSTPDYTVYNENRILIDAFDKFDGGLTGGLTFHIDHLLLGIRYNQGLVDITKKDARVLLGNGKTAVGQLSLGYKF